MSALDVRLRIHLIPSWLAPICFGCMGGIVPNTNVCGRISCLWSVTNRAVFVCLSTFTKCLNTPLHSLEYNYVWKEVLSFAEQHQAVVGIEALTIGSDETFSFWIIWFKICFLEREQLLTAL